ncbi:hypothetical protein SDC9_61846 [bioreactor metagenome]|uniref:Uncharacterized protein n=1 Tax=bioreactor metagenome TaxID=1076179 RepID=A0A644XGX6_9ZZZZ
MQDPFAHKPAESSSSSGYSRCDEGIHCNAVHAERAAGIEAEPAEQQQAGADHRHRDVMRSDRVFVGSFSDKDRSH